MVGKIFKALEKSKSHFEAHGQASSGGDLEILPEESSCEDESKTGTDNALLTHEDVAEEENSPNPEPKKQVDPRDEFNPMLDFSLVSALKPHSMAAEQFRILKTRILFPDRGKPPRSIMVTSTGPGEGKSFVAANLAISIANSIDEFVLLMDCDLRIPSVHSLFGYPDFPPGLSEYLSKGLSLADVFLKTEIDKLTLLPGGKPPQNPSELVSSDLMRQLICEVKSRYEDRYIIMDSPPPYLTSEADALARQVDGIILVVKMGQSKKDKVQDIIDTYGREKILGVVTNFSKNRSGYGYSTYRYIYQ